MMLNKWILFENDCCDDCGHPKVMKLSPKPDQLQVIVSCDCDMTVFDHAWKEARDDETMIVFVGKMTVLESIAYIAESISKGEKK